ncbi:MarR family winged helix-turn-helix transcriptional regulator [Phenylobacterium sp.]|uniref:MarR family winged helix-turn-helix transcriptional regulator n=1 Tax=Phenylobacterium sp. TaxID=1871053 RepID=UPI002F928550
MDLKVVREVLLRPGINQRELAAELDLGSSLVGVLDLLAERGLIERRQSLHDRRPNLLYPSPGAREFLSEGEGILRALEADLLSGFDLQDLQTSLLLLSEMIRRLRTRA